MKKLLSVIIPCHNINPIFFARTMKSIFMQDIGMKCIEIILVDDCSDDGKTFYILSEYENTYPNDIKIIQLQENLRQGGARNVALRYASGDYIAYCDADDWFEKDAFSIALELANREDADIVQFGYERVYEYNHPKERHLNYQDINVGVYNLQKADDRKKFLMKEHSQVCWNRIYKKTMLIDNDVRFAEHIVYEEVPFTFIAFLYAKKIVICDVPLYYYFQNSESTMNSRPFASVLPDMQRSYLQYLQKVRTDGLYETYMDEVVFFFWTGYFFLPLLYKAKYGDSFFSLDEFRRMQAVIKSFDVLITDNKYFLERFSDCIILGQLAYIDFDKSGLMEVAEALKTLSF